MQKKGVGVGRKQVWVAKKMSASLLRLWLAFFFPDKDLVLKCVLEFVMGRKKMEHCPPMKKF